MVRLNELTTWDHTRHANAYRTLLSAQSMRIADNLGIARPETQSICLDCHADNVAAELRGDRFQLADGVACEACHGGAERWLESHKAPGVDHADNLANGMYPTEEPLARARLCMSCHFGNSDQFVTHEMIGAGHPRLAFQLDIYAGWDEHYSDDADYRQRKSIASPIEHWLVGLAAMGTQMVDMVRERAGESGVEFALYHCDSCHHPVSLGRTPKRSPRWERRPNEVGMTGMVRLNDAPLRVLATVLPNGDLATADAQVLPSRLDELAVAVGRYELRDDVAARQLRSMLASLGGALLRATPSAESLKEVRRSLLERAAHPDIRYHADAEQIYFGVETLCYQLQDCDQDALDDWRETATDKLELDPSSFSFDLDRYQDAARRLAGTDVQ